MAAGNNGVSRGTESERPIVNLFILDTDTISLVKGNYPLITGRIEKVHPNQIAIAVVTVEEMLSGWQAVLRRPISDVQVARIYEEIVSTVKLASSFSLLPFPVPAIEIYRSLKSSRLNVGSNDLKIAAIALYYDATVVTRNLRDFQRVPALNCVDWSSG